MTLLARKLEAVQSPVDGSDVLAVLDRRLKELQERRDFLTALIIETELTVAPANTAANQRTEQALELLDGKKFVASREQPISQLAALHAERVTIDAALAIGRSRHHRLATERAGEIWAAHFAEIAEIEKRRVVLALQLQRANREREKLRERIAKAGGAGFLSTDGVDLLGFGDVVDECNWAAERLVADGIASRREIEKAVANG